MTSDSIENHLLYYVSVVLFTDGETLGLVVLRKKKERKWPQELGCLEGPLLFSASLPARVKIQSPRMTYEILLLSLASSSIYFLYIPCLSFTLNYSQFSEHYSFSCLPDFVCVLCGQQTPTHLSKDWVTDSRDLT